MARSVGAAAAAGLESGMGLGLRMRDQELQEREIARRTKQQDEDRVYLTEERTRKRAQEDDDLALRAIEDQYSAMRDEGDGLIQQYGGYDKVPAEIQGSYKQRSGELTAARRQIMEKRYSPIVEKRRQQLADLSSRLQSGQIDIKDVPHTDLYQVATTAARRDPRDLLSVNGAPSVVDQAVTDTLTGFETQNGPMMLRGANVLLAPELKVGVGETSPHGGKIVGKEIVELIPHPQDPNKFLPVVKVYVNRGKDFRGPVPDGVPKGATGYYIAPVTEHRSGEPDDPIKAIDIKEAMDYAGRMQTLSQVLSQPGMREKIERGAAEADKNPDNFLTAFFQVKGRMPEKKVEWKSVPAGGLVGVDSKTGQVTGDRVEGTPRSSTGGLQATADGIDRLTEEGVLSPEEGLGLKRDAARRQATGLRKGSGGGGGGAGGGGLSGPTPRKGVTGAELLSQLSEDDATIVEGLASGTIRPAEISTRNNRREKMVALAKRYDPTADFGPDGRLKEVPVDARKAMVENNTSMARAQRALRLVGGAPANLGEEKMVDKNATGFKGYMPNQLLNRLDPKGVDARAAISDLGSLVINARSGAAVTAAEFPRLAPFVPSAQDDDKTVVKKLEQFIQVYKEETEALQSAYGPDNGYKAFKVGRSGSDAPPDTQHRQSGQVTEPPARLPADPKAAAAAYAALPSGAEFVDPKGVMRRKP